MLLSQDRFFFRFLFLSAQSLTTTCPKRAIGRMSCLRSLAVSPSSTLIDLAPAYKTLESKGGLPRMLNENIGQIITPRARRQRRGWSWGGRNNRKEITDPPVQIIHFVERAEKKIMLNTRWFEMDTRRALTVKVELDRGSGTPTEKTVEMRKSIREGGPCPDMMDHNQDSLLLWLVLQHITLFLPHSCVLIWPKPQKLIRQVDRLRGLSDFNASSCHTLIWFKTVPGAFS